jgi:hypothetical protein
MSTLLVICGQWLFWPFIPGSACDERPVVVSVSPVDSALCTTFAV